MSTEVKQKNVTEDQKLLSEIRDAVVRYRLNSDGCTVSLDALLFYIVKWVRCQSENPPDLNYYLRVGKEGHYKGFEAQEEYAKRKGYKCNQDLITDTEAWQLFKKTRSRFWPPLEEKKRRKLAFMVSRLEKLLLLDLTPNEIKELLKKSEALEWQL